MLDCITIADAVASEINVGSFSVPVTAARRLLPEFELAELVDLKVSVVPKLVEMTPFSRQYTQYDFAIDIGIQKKLSGNVDAEMPPMLALVEEINAYLRSRKLTAKPAAVWIKSVVEPIYAREHLSQSRVFTSVITVTYRMVG